MSGEVPSPRVLIAGCGYVGSALAELLLSDGCSVEALRRDPARLPGGVRGVAGDVGSPGSLTELTPLPDAVVYAVSPSERSAEAYRTAYLRGPGHVLSAVSPGARFPGRFVLVSSTGAYGHTDGSRVTEDTEPWPTAPTARIIVEAERAARSLARETVVLRLGGIYGPGRDRTIRRVVEGDARCPPPGRFGNRIHRDDAAAAIHHLLRLPRPHGLYLGVDRDPAELRTVYHWIARRAGVPDPCDPTSSSAPSSTVERTGPVRPNKRCSSDRLVQSGFTFRYPTFREGYASLMA